MNHLIGIRVRRLFTSLGLPAVLFLAGCDAGIGDETTGLPVDSREVNGLITVNLSGSQRDWLNRARMIAREKIEVSRKALGLSFGSDVRDLARRIVTREQSILATLEYHAVQLGDGETPQAPADLIDRIDKICEQSGVAFDADYAKLMVDLNRECLAVYARLQATWDDGAPLGPIIREQREQLRLAEAIAEPLVR